MRYAKNCIRIVVAIVVAALFLAGSPALAAPRDGQCLDGEFCYFYNSDQAGSISDFTESVGNYGTAQPTCYEFKGSGNGAGDCIKNNAASVWNRSPESVRVYLNSDFAGNHQDFPPGAKGNLDAALKNNNASHKFLGSSEPQIQPGTQEVEEMVTIRFIEEDTPEPPCDWNCRLTRKIQNFGVNVLIAGTEAKSAANCVAEGLGLSRYYGCTFSDAADTVAPVFEGCLHGALTNQVAEAFLKNATASIPSSAYWCVMTAAAELGYRIEGVN